MEFQQVEKEYISVDMGAVRRQARARRNECVDQSSASRAFAKAERPTDPVELPKIEAESRNLRFEVSIGKAAISNNVSIHGLVERPNAARNRGSTSQART